jgi:Caspase domain
LIVKDEAGILMRSRASVRLALAVVAVLVLAGAVGLRAEDRGVAVVATQPMFSEKRVALVIGNAAYTVGPLNNPVLDSRAVAKALRGLGFEVVAHENLDLYKMESAVREFGERIPEGGVGLFYYAGHGLQVNDLNYLVPINASIKSPDSVLSETLNLDRVLTKMKEAKTRVSIVILDACRNNPFTQRFRGGPVGLASINPRGTYIAYATAPGSVADDGEPGKNGLYTGELVRELSEPGNLRIEDVFQGVRGAVLRLTNDRQNPYDSTSLTRNFFFNPRVASVTPPAAPPQAKVVIKEEVDPARNPFSKWFGELRERYLGPHPPVIPLDTTARPNAHVAAGMYECWGNGQARTLMNFTVRDASHYAGSYNGTGTFSFDAETTRITFKGGSLDGVLPDGWYAIYHAVRGRPTISFVSEAGAAATFCEKNEAVGLAAGAPQAPIDERHVEAQVRAARAAIAGVYAEVFPPVGAYQCSANGQAHMLMNFTILDATHYAGFDNGVTGTFSIDAATSRITFKGGPLDGVMPDGFYSIYHTVRGRPTVSFMSPVNPTDLEVMLCQKS